MEELIILLAKASSNTKLINDIQLAINNIKANGETSENLRHLAAQCHLFMLKIIMGDEDVHKFIDKFNKDKQLINAFNNKQ